MNAPFLPAGFSPPFVAWLRRHVRLESRVNHVALASVHLDDRGYCVTLDARTDAFDDATRRTLILHEVGHVMRGDCVAAMTRAADKTRDPADVAREARAWNIAADAVINHALNQDHLRELRAILYDDYFRARHPHLPEIPPNASVLVPLVPDEPEAPQMCGGASGDGDEKTAAKARAAHAAAVLDGRDVAEIQNAARAAGLGGRTRTSERIAVTPPDALARALAQLRTRHLDGVRIRTRTYARPGRVDGLKGVAFEPRARVLVAVDVSGSMTEHVARALGLAEEMRRDLDVRVGVFADRYAPTRGGDLPDVGGGTDFQPPADAAATERADALVFVSDGQGAPPRLPAIPVYWVLPAGERAPVLRPGDAEFVLCD